MSLPPAEHFTPSSMILLGIEHAPCRKPLGGVNPYRGSYNLLAARSRSLVLILSPLKQTSGRLGREIASQNPAGRRQNHHVLTQRKGSDGTISKDGTLWQVSRKVRVQASFMRGVPWFDGNRVQSWK
ncbi:hypothetical protein C8035_v009609 [Colletotrichum spinosum]|uniref:Uncharacterized protein n=1 Tax=Colletotrichum spinosum TaxID=1347390 RepID=A0A4R8Q6S4_9PEZI|nr:hypothetical protein C8035_v009609 [Colletotrichum spinosum]